MVENKKGITMANMDQLNDKAVFMTLLKQASHRGLSQKAMTILQEKTAQAGENVMDWTRAKEKLGALLARDPGENTVPPPGIEVEIIDDDDDMFDGLSASGGAPG